MKTNFKKLLTVILATVSLNGAALADDIRLGEPGYGGNGCPAGSASAILSPDQKSLSIIFDQFQVEADSYTRTARKSCNIAIPVHVPQGLSISIVDVDYRGFVSLPERGAQARFTAEYFFAGTLGPRFSKTWVGPTDQDYTIANNIGLSSLVWSPCGADVTLRVNSAMMVRAVYQQALATVDSADFNAGIVYKIQWKRCGSNVVHDDFSSYSL
jgi:hypothetical protein